MPWAPPSWCKTLRPDAPAAVVTLQSHNGLPRRHDLSNSAYYLLERSRREGGKAGEKVSRWHAAVLRDEQGNCFIMDLNTSSGTFMNEQRLKPNRACRWMPGTTVVLGVPPFHEKVSLQLARGPKRPRDESSEEAEGRPAKQRRCGAEAGTACGGGAGSSSSTSGPSKLGKTSAGAAKKCDKCDGPHPTDACPHFKKPREEHKDAWQNYGRKSPLQMGRNGGKLIIRGGQAVPQPGDGSCLYHSLCFGLNGGRPSGRSMAFQLRKELAQFVQQNPQVKISGDTLEEWVRWDANASVASYTRRMATGGWGGGIEMAACSLLKRVNVHVYERRRGGGFERISCFDSPTPTQRTIHVLYQGGVHYDALVPRR